MKLKNCLYVLILVFVYGVANTQVYTTDYEIAPMVEGCDELPHFEDQVKCSEAQLLRFFTSEVDHKFCPLEGTTRLYNVNFMVSAFGNIDRTNCNAYQASDSCLLYFNQKAASFADKYVMSPAKKANKRIAGNKFFSFSYPPLSDLEISDDTDNMVVDKSPDEMPRFIGCEDIVGSLADKNACSQNYLLRAIYSQLIYPYEARNKGIEGTVVVQFVVDTDGMINEPKIVRSLEGGCDEAVLDLVELINEMNPPFVPGVKDGQKVNVLYTLPVKFKLE